jgi:PKD repeat protein
LAPPLSNVDTREKKMSGEYCEQLPWPASWTRVWRANLSGNLFALVATLAFAHVADGAEVTLAWDSVDDSRVAFYEVHWGTISSDYAWTKQSASASTTVDGLIEGSTYYFAARACNQDATLCSEFSNEVSATIPYGEPTADFTVVDASGEAPLTVTFSDTSTGTIDSYAWDFGDGSTSTERSPSYTYGSPGTYTVALSVVGPGGSSTATKPDAVVVEYSPPVADFTESKLAGLAPLSVTFEDRSVGEIDSYAWDFGDGDTSVASTAVHSYGQSGTYTVTLEVTGPGGTATKIKSDLITVSPPPPAAVFSAAPTMGQAPLTVQFSDASTGEITSYRWSFGDGWTSNETNPVYNYQEPGQYDVSLTVTGPGGSDTFEQTVTVTDIGDPPGPTVVFFDDFETDLGWDTDPNGTDTATTGIWERADPQGTSSSGPKQLADTVSGAYALVTGAAAGSSAGTDDIDNGVTSIRSPDIDLPAGKDLIFSCSYYLAHTSGSSTDDFLQVKVVGDITETVLEERGDGNDDDAAWESATVSLSQFAGQTVYLLIEAADAGGGSIVEAAIDDLSIVGVEPATPILTGDFDESPDGFIYVDDAFRATSNPAYADGGWERTGGYAGGGLRVELGGLDNDVINDMSGGWQTSFILEQPQTVIVALSYNLTQTSDYEADEYSDVLLSVNGVLYGKAGDYLARITGDGNGGSVQTTGWQTVELDLGVLSAGEHTLAIGGYNNKKTYNNEATEVVFDDLAVSIRPVPQVEALLSADFDAGADGLAYVDDAFRATSNPAYADGYWDATGGDSGGALRVELGGLDNATVNGMSGGWQTSFSLDEPQQVVVSVRYNLTQALDYESDEYSDALLSVNGVLYGQVGDALGRITGDGNGGSAQTTGWRTAELNIGVLLPGEHTLAIGGYNNKKTYNNEFTDVIIDSLRVDAY